MSLQRLKPYRFSFLSESLNPTERVYWIRFYNDMETAFNNSKRVALLENPDAHSFMIESDQDDVAIRKSWGLPS